MLPVQSDPYLFDQSDTAKPERSRPQRPKPQPSFTAKPIRNGPNVIYPAPPLRTVSFLTGAGHSEPLLPYGPDHAAPLQYCRSVPPLTDPYRDSPLLPNPSLPPYTATNRTLSVPSFAATPKLITSNQYFTAIPKRYGPFLIASSHYPTALPIPICTPRTRSILTSSATTNQSLSCHSEPLLPLRSGSVRT
jgi:hypothetical protein